MPRRTEATPSQPTVISKAGGLIIQVGTTDTTAEQAKSIIRTIVNKNLPGGWKITTLDLSGRMFSVSPDTSSREIGLGKAWELARKLEELSDINFAEVDVVVPGHDPLPIQVMDRRHALRGFSGGKTHKNCSSSHEWSLEKLNALNAWDLRPPRGGKRFGEGIQIAHPDTGYTKHPEIFDGRLLVAKGYDFEDNDSDPLDPMTGQAPGHGTSTASVILSDRDDDVDSTVSGTAPLANLVPLRVSTSVIHLKFSNLVSALYKAIETDSHVVSMSLGGPFHSKALEAAANEAVQNGLILVAAAGNRWPFVVYPAKLDQVIAVAATNCQDKPWSGSAKGKAVDVAAPGESIWRARTKEPDQYIVKRSHGTSYAAAATSGVCALWLAYWGRDRLIDTYGTSNLAAVFKSLLVKEGVRLPPNWKRKRYGAGIIDAKALLEATLPDRAPARRFRFAARPATAPGADELSEVLDYFPGVPRSRMMAVLAKSLKVDEDDLPEALKTYGAEFRFHLASNPEVRVRLRSQADPARRLLRGLSPRQILTNEQFKTGVPGIESKWGRVTN